MAENSNTYPVWPGWDTCRLIGEGSFGRVYEVHKTDFPSVRSAMKVISIPQNLSEVRALMNEGMDQKSATSYFYSFVQEIVKEFELLSQLRGHSNIVSYEDSMVISHNDAIGWDVFIRMEYLYPMLDAPGVKEDWRRTAKVGLDMCRALELCRRYNIIHRDIKPENIFVSANDDFKLGDFGIARTVEKTTSGMSRKGTYAYMAPEVYRGDAYGAAADQYSLGLVLYWLLNDRRTPFLPPAPMDITYNDKEQALAQRMSGERIPEPKNGCPLMKAAVLRACSYDPKDRFASPSDFGRAIQEALFSDDRTANLMDARASQEPIYTPPSPPKPMYTPPSPPEPIYTPPSPPKPIYTPPSPPEPPRKAIPFEHSYDTSLHKADKQPAQQKRLNKDEKGPKSQPTPKPSQRKRHFASIGKIKTNRISIAVIAVLSIIAVALALMIVIPSLRYSKAESLLTAGDKSAAAIAFGKMGDARDAQQRSVELWAEVANREAVSAGDYHTVGLKTDRAVVSTGNNDDGQCEVSGWSDIIAVSAKTWHTVGLKSDGTVVAVGRNDYGQCQISGWSDIVSVSAGARHTVGLSADGTVVAIGNNDDGQCEVSGWSDVIAVSAGARHTVGLRADGTVVAAGDNDDGQCEISGWTDIIAVCAGDSHTVGLKADGAVVATGYNKHGQCDVSGWSDVKAISAGGNHTVGLRANGKVVAVGWNDDGQCEVSDWTDVIAVCAGGNHTVGLKANGSVLAIGDNRYGQCEVSGWRGIRLP